MMNAYWYVPASHNNQLREGPSNSLGRTCDEVVGRDEADHDDGELEEPVLQPREQPATYRAGKQQRVSFGGMGPRSPYTSCSDDGQGALRRSPQQVHNDRRPQQVQPPV